MKRKLLATLLLIGVLMTMLPIFTLSAGAETTTTETRREIGTKEGLVNFVHEIASGNDFKGVTIYLTADIDMGGDTWEMSGKAPVFSGMIDGQGHTITGLKMSTQTITNQGLFGGCLMPVGDDSFTVGVKNLTIKDSSVTSNMTGNAFVGGLFGQINNKDNNDAKGKVLFENLDLDIAVSAKGNYCGGIAGCSRADEMTISNCILRGDVSGASLVGGLIGQEMDKELTTASTVVSGTVKSNNINVGGFFGHVRERAGSQGSNTKITNCVFNGTVETSFTQVGGNVGIGGFAGLVGDTNNGPRPGKLTIEDSAFYGTLKLTGNGIVGKIGALVGSTQGGDNAVVTFRRILVAGGIEIAGTPTYNYGKLIGIAASTSTYVSDMVVENLTITVAGKAANWAWGNFSTNNATNKQTNQISTAISVGSEKPVYTAGDKTVDLSGSFLTTPATKPLPLGVLDFFAVEINAKNADTAPTVAEAYQIRTASAESKTNDARLIGLLKCNDEQFDSFTGVGFEITVIRKDGKTVRSLNNLGADGKAPSTAKVYSSILANGETKQANDIKAGYQYIFTATIEQLPKDATGVTFAVRTFHDEGEIRTYDSMTVFTYPIPTEA